jgi:hypothetical protein
MKKGIWCIVFGVLFLVVGFWLISKDEPVAVDVVDEQEPIKDAPVKPVKFDDAVVIETKLTPQDEEAS